jgi:hypothetical protein
MVETKICRVCKRELPLNNQYFPERSDSKDGFRNDCLECQKAYDKSHHPIYYKENKVQIIKHNNQYVTNNRDKRHQTEVNYQHKAHQKILARQRRYRKDNPERTKKLQSINYQRNREKRIKYAVKYCINRLKTDIAFRLNMRFASYLRQCLRRGKNGRHWEIIVGYTLEDLMNHLESQFKDGINWDNFGKWHIDHIIPVSAFHFESYDDPEFKACWALSNLQPLWALDNLKKGNKIITRKLRLL